MSNGDMIRRVDALRLMPADTADQEALRQDIAALPAVTPGVKAEARGDVAGLVEALRFYADEDEYETNYETLPCDCCTDIYEPVMRDRGDKARAALAAWECRE
jgi:hypothetical protein